MDSESLQVEDEAQQHFPTYRFKERDVVLEELKLAAKSLESEERLFINATNVSVIFVAAAGSLIVGSLDEILSLLAPILPPLWSLILLIFIVVVFARMALSYFAYRQKVIVYAARKVVVLRRMLGISYGTQRLVLPNWRLEGADEPFAIRMFPGWSTPATLPGLAVTGISTLVCFVVLVFIQKQKCVDALSSSLVSYSIPYPRVLFPILVSLLIYLYLITSFRRALYDVHENSMIRLGHFVAKVLRVGLENNFEYVMYRAYLAKYELKRNIRDLSALKRMLIFIEDGSFTSHFGISFRGIGRSLKKFVCERVKTGGSTITQQLVRSIFIRDLEKRFRRKIVEIIFALGFDRKLEKNDQLEVYLASVRFERGIYGVVAAFEYFWGGPLRSPSSSEAFFLIERVSNINSRLLGNKVSETLTRAKRDGLLSKEELKEIIILYSKAIKDGKIIDEEEKELGKLAKVVDES
ncbi:MAG: transglycosylase domain-containing protein [Acidobacteriota bacterium]|nr:MAG: transglycosylase domain-containing protein [Acidobacteriota bacterium]